MPENKGFTLHRIEFDVESETRDPVKDKYGLLGYLIEFERIDHEDGSDYFVGITQVPGLERYDGDLERWKNEVLPTRVRPIIYRPRHSEENFRPSLRAQSVGPDRFKVEFFEEDIHLEDLYELLTGHPPYPAETTT